MPVFDGSSQPSRAEAELLRSVLGPAKPRATSLRDASRAYHRRQRLSRLRRCLIVLALAGAFCSSALMMSRNAAVPRIAAQSVPSEADPVSTGSIRTSEECLSRPSHVARANAETRAQSTACR
jgi:hypothetical protein